MQLPNADFDVAAGAAAPRSAAARRGRLRERDLPVQPAHQLRGGVRPRVRKRPEHPEDARRQRHGAEAQGRHATVKEAVVRTLAAREVTLRAKAFVLACARARDGAGAGPRNVVALHPCRANTQPGQPRHTRHTARRARHAARPPGVAADRSRNGLCHHLAVRPRRRAPQTRARPGHPAADELAQAHRRRPPSHRHPLGLGTIYERPSSTATAACTRSRTSPSRGARCSRPAARRTPRSRS
jgi:hypothetical protein